MLFKLCDKRDSLEKSAQRQLINALKNISQGFVNGEIEKIAEEKLTI